MESSDHSDLILLSIGVDFDPKAGEHTVKTNQIEEVSWSHQQRNFGFTRKNKG